MKIFSKHRLKMNIVNASPVKVYVILFVLIALCYIAYFTMKSFKNEKITAEHFTTEPGNYDSRMRVMNVFDGYLHRNPTVEEIDKYSKFGNEQDILVEVMKDNLVPNVVNQEDNIHVKEEECFVSQEDSKIKLSAKIQSIIDQLKDLETSLLEEK